MMIAAYLVVAITAFLSISSIAARQRRKNWMKEDVVYLPFYLACVGIVCGGILSIPAVVCAMDGDWMFAFFEAIVLACNCMMIAYLNCVIRYNDKGFVVRTFFGIRRSCNYAEVEGIRFGRDHRVYFQGHSIMLDEISVGREQFIEAIDKGYKRATGKWVPSIKRKCDPMNGHIDYPWAYFCLWIFLGAFCAALPVLIVYSMTRETDPAKVTMHNAVFTNYEIMGDELCLYGEDGSTSFLINYYRSYGDALPAPEKLCSGESYLIGTTGKKNYVRCLSDEFGRDYITFETERKVYRDNQRVATCFLVVFSILGVVFCYFGIAIARHPERYGDRFRRLFYKDGVLY